MVCLTHAEWKRVEREIVDRFYEDPEDATHQEDLEAAAYYWWDTEGKDEEGNEES